MYNKQELEQKAKEFLASGRFTFLNHQNNSKIEFTPITSCNLLLPVNRVSETIISGFVDFLLDQQLKEEILKNTLKIPPQET